ncbi:MAG TPA: hypothetical protein VGU63_06945 [Candidatus Acidoferrales bacterium]|nr:hypothetical protein [Candidatus Acidoferrales bacterium]
MVMHGILRIRRVIFAAIVCLLGFSLALPILTIAQGTQKTSSGQEAPGSTLPKGKKLVMKDGTSQTASSYQVQGDRVRYFSVERGEWEEVPAAAVDWDATKKAQADDTRQAEALDAKLKAEDAAARVAPLDVDASLEIVPGVFLPPGEGVFILDGRAIFPLHQSPASSKLSKKRLMEQVVIPVPVVPSRRGVDLEGAHASFRITNSSPEFYLRTTDPGQPEVELIEAHVHGDKRHIEDIDNFMSQQQEKRKTVSLQIWEVAKGVYRFTLGQPLKPGEYALAEVSAKEGMNLLVWDFGVDAARGKQPKTVR